MQEQYHSIEALKSDADYAGIENALKVFSKKNGYDEEKLRYYLYITLYHANCGDEEAKNKLGEFFVWCQFKYLQKSKKHIESNNSWAISRKQMLNLSQNFFQSIKATRWSVMEQVYRLDEATNILSNTPWVRRRKKHFSPIFQEKIEILEKEGKVKVLPFGFIKVF